MLPHLMHARSYVHSRAPLFPAAPGLAAFSRKVEKDPWTGAETKTEADAGQQGAPKFGGGTLAAIFAGGTPLYFSPQQTWLGSQLKAAKGHDEEEYLRLKDEWLITPATCDMYQSALVALEMHARAQPWRDRTNRPLTESVQECVDRVPAATISNMSPVEAENWLVNVLEQDGFSGVLVRKNMDGGRLLTVSELSSNEAQSEFGMGGAQFMEVKWAQTAVRRAVKHPVDEMPEPVSVKKYGTWGPEMKYGLNLLLEASFSEQISMRPASAGAALELLGAAVKTHERKDPFRGSVFISGGPDDSNSGPSPEDTKPPGFCSRLLSCGSSKVEPRGRSDSAESLSSPQRPSSAGNSPDFHGRGLDPTPEKRETMNEKPRDSRVSGRQTNHANPRLSALGDHHSRIKRTNSREVGSSHPASSRASHGSRGDRSHESGSGTPNREMERQQSTMQQRTGGGSEELPSPRNASKDQWDLTRVLGHKLLPPAAIALTIEHTEEEVADTLGGLAKTLLMHGDVEGALAVCAEWLGIAAPGRARYDAFGAYSNLLKRHSDRVHKIELSRLARRHWFDGMLGGDMTLKNLTKSLWTKGTPPPLVTIDLYDQRSLKGPVLEKILGPYGIPTLKNLNLYKCYSATGTIPRSICACRDLKMLNLHMCQHTGEDRPVSNA